MAEDKNLMRRYDLVGGMDQSTNPFLLAEDKFTYLKNIVHDELGTLSKDGGYQKISDSVGESGVDLISEYVNWEGLRTPVMITGGKFYKGGDEWTLISSSHIASGNRCSAANHQDRLYWTDSQNVVRYFDGFSVSDIASSNEGAGVKGKYLTTLGSRLILGHCTAIHGKNQVVFSNEGSEQFYDPLRKDEDEVEETYSTTKNIISVTGEITGIKSYQGLLFIWSSSEVYFWNPDSPEVVNLLAKTGCVGHDTIQEIDGALYWASKDGVYRFSGEGMPSVISLPITDWVINSIWRSINGSSWEEMSAGVVDGKYHLWVGDLLERLPGDSKRLKDVVVIYDSYRDTWTFLDNHPVRQWADIVEGQTGGETAVLTTEEQEEWKYLPESVVNLNSSSRAVRMAGDGMTFVESITADASWGDLSYDSELHITKDRGVTWTDIKPKDIGDFATPLGNQVQMASQGPLEDNTVRGLHISEDGQVILAIFTFNIETTPYTEAHLSTDGGGTWSNITPEELNSELSEDFKIVTTQMSGNGQVIVLAANLPKTLPSDEYYPSYISTDQGVTWSPIGASTAFSSSSGHTHLGMYVHRVALSFAGDVILLYGEYGNSFRLLLSKDYGETWTVPQAFWEDGSSIILGRNLAVSPNGNLMAATVPPVIFAEDIPRLWISQDGGDSWQSSILPNESPNRSYGGIVIGRNGEIFVVGAVGGLFFISKDVGLTWTEYSPYHSSNTAHISIDGSVLSFAHGNSNQRYRDNKLDSETALTTETGSLLLAEFPLGFKGKRELIFGSRLQGQVYRRGRFYEQDGQAIESVVRSKYFDFEAPELEKTLESFYVSYRPEQEENKFLDVAVATNGSNDYQVILDNSSATRLPLKGMSTNEYQFERVSLNGLRGRTISYEFKNNDLGICITLLGYSQEFVYNKSNMNYTK